MPDVLGAAHKMGSSHQHPHTHWSSLVSPSPCVSASIYPSCPHSGAHLAPPAKSIPTSRHIYPITGVGTRIRTMVAAAITHSTDHYTIRAGHTWISTLQLVSHSGSVSHHTTHHLSTQQECTPLGSFSYYFFSPGNFSIFQ